ncbi:MAG: hypothetical protein M1160_02875 [Candidatus Marsarchaeota archaeon]|jgi:uncharacterized protein (UPF0333 family)|nr:hypothetical protein [Candidatus Marsarchaeota archaeon]MCL5111797.1 hypothetical protein [Candidatus Marsarchaeota archaeon]
MRSSKWKKGQSSFELLITVSFGLIVLLPIVVLAFIQISASNSSLAATEAQAAASKLASIATSVGAQGYPARQLVLVQVPPSVENVYVGTQSNGVGHAVIFVISTSAGPSYVTAYTPVNVSGQIGGISSQGSYLINVSAQNSCPADASISCVYIRQAS